MFLQVLAILDIVSALWLLLLQYFDLSIKISYILGIYLISKFLLWQEFMSFFDAVAGVMILFAAYHHISSFTYLFIIWMIFKGVMSLYQIKA